MILQDAADETGGPDDTGSGRDLNAWH